MWWSKRHQAHLLRQTQSCFLSITYFHKRKSQRIISSLGCVQFKNSFLLTQVISKILTKWWTLSLAESLTSSSWKRRPLKRWCWQSRAKNLSITNSWASWLKSKSIGILQKKNSYRLFITSTGKRVTALCSLRLLDRAIRKVAIKTLMIWCLTCLISTTEFILKSHWKNLRKSKV